MPIYYIIYDILLQINLGLIEENPSSTVGTIKIMERLQEHVPCDPQGLYPVVCYGDGLSVERMTDAK